MPTKLIELDDGILIEIDAPEDDVQQISGGFVERVNTNIDKIESILTKVTKPISNAWQKIDEEVDIEKATVELGLSFEGEGNLFVTKSTAGANLTVTLELKPKAKKANESQSSE